MSIKNLSNEVSKRFRNVNNVHAVISVLNDGDKKEYIIFKADKQRQAKVHGKPFTDVELAKKEMARIARMNKWKFVHDGSRRCLGPAEQSVATKTKKPPTKTKSASPSRVRAKKASAGATRVRAKSASSRTAAKSASRAKGRAQPQQPQAQAA